METFRLSHQRLHLHFLLRWEGKTFESFPWLASDMKEKQVWRNVSWYAYSFWYWKGSDRWSSMILKKKHLLFVVCLCAFWWFWNKDENTCDLSLRLSINLSNLGCRKQQLRKPRLFGRLSESNLFRVSMVFFLGTNPAISGCLLVDSRSRWAVAKFFPLSSVMIQPIYICRWNHRVAQA